MTSKVCLTVHRLIPASSVFIVKLISNFYWLYNPQKQIFSYFKEILCYQPIANKNKYKTSKEQNSVDKQNLLWFFQFFTLISI